MWDKQLVSQPSVLGFALEEPPIHDDVPISADDGGNDRGDPGYDLPFWPFVEGVGCSCTHGYDCCQIFHPVVALVDVSLVVDTTQTLHMIKKLTLSIFFAA